MALTFRCQNCGENIIVKYLAKGEIAKCMSCGTENVVPENAIITDETSSAEKFHEKVSQDFTVLPTLEIPKPKPDSPTGYDFIIGFILIWSYYFTIFPILRLCKKIDFFKNINFISILIFSIFLYLLLFLGTSSVKNTTNHSLMV